MPPRPVLAAATALLLLGPAAACARTSGGATACGITAMAGPALLLDQFNTAGATLGVPPRDLPGVLPVRLATGPAFRAVVARSDSGWLAGVDGTLPARPVPGFGVLVMDRSEGPRGILLYEGVPIRGAPVLGSVATSQATLPLIGIEVRLADFENPNCPVFPDSLRR